MNIAILDGVVIAVVLISAILAMFRGFVREVLSIAAWVAAAILAYMFYEDLMPYVGEYVDNVNLVIGISAVAIFLVSLIVVSLITMKISDFVMDSPVGALDRLLGFIFGAARGLLLAIVAIMIVNLLVEGSNRPAWLTEAATYPKLTEWANGLFDALPASVREAVVGTAGEIDDAASDALTPGDPDFNGTPQDPINETIDSTTDEPDTVVEPAEPAPFDPADPTTPGTAN